MSSEATVAKSAVGQSLGIVETITVFLTQQRGLLRCLGALCLVLLGVHASADWVDDKVFFLVDLFDSGLDSVTFAVCAWLGSWSFISESTMQAWAFRWAEWIGPEEKEYLSLLFALFSEILLDLLLVGYAWGVRASAVEESRLTDRQRIRIVFQDTKKAMRTGDLALVFTIPAVLLFSLSGAFVAGQGIERLSIDF